MLLQPTLDRLHSMRLTGMADALTGQLEQPEIGSLSFEERLGLLVDQEWTYRQNRRLTRLLHEAKLRDTAACVEDINFREPRGLDRSLVFTLATCEWVRHHQTVLITGPTGAGKTYIACALANAACRRGFSARYFRLSRLLTAISMARGDGSYPKFLQKLSKTDLLVLDDWGLAPMDAMQSRELLEIIDDRVQTRAILIASQLPLREWHGTMADPTAADAILDRLVHGAYKLLLNGESMRKVRTGEDDPQQDR